MAQLTTLDGYQVYFDPDGITCVTDHDLASGDAATCVYGVADGALKVHETVEGFLTRIGTLAGFARLGLPSGKPIWMNAKAVSVLRPRLPEEYSDTVRTVVSANGKPFGISDPPDDVRARINAHGGKL